MRMNAYIAGVGMTPFGKHLDTTLKALGAQAIKAALEDAGIGQDAIEAAYVGNAVAGIVTGQECIRGQVVLRSMGMGKIPVINVENACASASTAFHQACAMVTAGLYDVVLAAGVEKLYHVDKQVSFTALTGAIDVDGDELLNESLGLPPKGGPGGVIQKMSIFMKLYADMAHGYMDQYGATARDFAAVSAKNSLHGSLNPRAQFRKRLSVDDVLAEPMIVDPLTRPMCSPIGDGAAAAVVVSEKKARELGLTRPVRVATCVLRSGWDHEPGEPSTSEVCAQEAYEEAGIAPEDIDIAECHDASAPSEVIACEAIGLCGPGEGARLVTEGHTTLGGRIPVNVSGGLLRKGHPPGATGLAQIVELTEQLQGRAGDRQVQGARIGLAHNGGGMLGLDAAAMCVTLLEGVKG